MEDWTRIATCLRQQGMHVSDEFVKAAIAGDMTEESGRTVYEKSLWCDFNVCGLGCLPSDIQKWDKQILAGRVVLQIDEVVDMASSAKQRYDGSTGSARCLKLYMTDGKLHVCGFEQERVPELAPLMQAGIKVALQDVLLRRGLMALTPRNVKILGGKVDRLEEARQRAVKRWQQPIACNSGIAGHGVRQSLYEEAIAAAWPADGTGRVGPGREGDHAAPVPPASRGQAVKYGPVQEQAEPRTQPSQQHAPTLPGIPLLAPVQDAQAVEEAQPNYSSSSALESSRQNGTMSHQRQKQKHLTADHTQATSAANNADQRQSEAYVMDSTADADSWSSADPYWDAVEEHLPPADEVVELSGNNDSSAGLSAPPPAMQQVDSPASRAQAPDQVNVVSSRGRYGTFASIAALSQPVRTDGAASHANEISTFAAVTEMVGNLQFLDKHKHALQQYSMEVRIEERASGDECIASVHPKVLEEVLGMTPAEMRDSLAQGQHDRVRERISYLKNFVSTFAGEMLLHVAAAQSQPVICHFGSVEAAGFDQSLQQRTDPSSQ